ncbi:glucosamine-6-phosphate deaminase [Tundrisphaera sp. TA3]|uniref:glucosamine-6-phosphate deaminase n=1 Tax=Tundrisphaera sp. TA3 TaxID=3435775 RepID=UPI003EC153C9
MPDSQSPRLLEFSGASVQVFAEPEAACQAAARQIARAITDAVAARGRAVLGLATGSTPIPVYRHLVAANRSGEVSFRDVATYNLDEYYPISPADPNSYRAFMHRHLLGHVDIAANRAHLLDGSVPEAFASDHAADFDRWMAAEGGLDLQLLGIGRNGHIGFNEPSDLATPEALALPTRMVKLHPTTIADAAKDFGGEALVPRQALTVGTAPILAARSILVLAFGPNKADAVSRSLLGPITAEVPGSLLRTAGSRVHWFIDQEAAQGLS